MAKDVDSCIADLQRSPNWSVRQGACWALGSSKDPRAVEPLIQGLGDKNWYVRQAACKALGWIGACGALEPLVERLGDNKWPVRQAACTALGQLGDPSAVEPLIERLDDEEWVVRRAACNALGQPGDPHAVSPLIQRLGDSDRAVRRAACEVLDKLGEGGLAQAVLRVFEKCEGATEALAAMAVCGDMRAADPLIAHIPRSNDWTRAPVCKALQAISDAVAPQVNQALCRECLYRLVRESTKLGPLRKVEYYVCRSCGKAGGAVFGIREVVAILDVNGSQDPIWKDGVVTANWLARRCLFDFDRVEIRSATDDDTMRFCVQVGNDTDDFRRKRYKSTPVQIHPGCRLEENTVRVLRSMFGEVTRA